MVVYWGRGISMKKILIIICFLLCPGTVYTQEFSSAVIYYSDFHKDGRKMAGGTDQILYIDGDKKSIEFINQNGRHYSFFDGEKAYEVLLFI